MAELDNIPQKQSIEIETVQIDSSIKEKIEQLTQKQNVLVSDFGQIHIRKREIAEELKNLEEILEKSENEFQSVSVELKQIFDDLDEKYPQMRVNVKDGIIQYQPGAPTRRQLAEQQGRSL
jgi:predicted nuclease with TOPRIM domain